MHPAARNSTCLYPILRSEASGTVSVCQGLLSAAVAVEYMYDKRLVSRNIQNVYFKSGMESKLSGR